MNFTLDKKQIHTFDEARLVLMWTLRTLYVTAGLVWSGFLHLQYLSGKHKSLSCQAVPFKCDLNVGFSQTLVRFDLILCHPSCHEMFRWPQSPNTPRSIHFHQDSCHEINCKTFSDGLSLSQGSLHNVIGRFRYWSVFRFKTNHQYENMIWKCGSRLP